MELRPVDGTRLAILGGQGAGMQIAHATARLSPAVEILGYLNDTVEPGTAIGGLPVLGPFSAWDTLDGDVRFIADIHAPKAMAERIERLEGLGIPRERWHTVVDPSAVVMQGVELGHNVFVSVHATIKPQARLGDHVTVRDGASVGHDAVLDAHSFVATNAIVGGFASLGRGAYVGLGAIVRERIAIGAMSVVGMGAVVIDDVPDGAVVAGNPARRIGPADEVVP